MLLPTGFPAWRFLASGLLLALTAGCRSSPTMEEADVVIPPRPPLFIGGSVIDAETGEPIAGALVCCHDRPTHWKADHETCPDRKTTGPGGEYEVSLAEHGTRVYLTASAPGYRHLEDFPVSYSATRIRVSLELEPEPPPR